MIVVWYKRDLRVEDHLPLTLAAQHGNVLPLYIIEPSVIYYDDYSRRHYAFVRDALTDLRQRLAALGQPLVVRYGEAVQVLADLHQHEAIEAIYGHEETGNARTYERDLDVREWARKQAIRLLEVPSGGVVRRLPTRDAWLETRNQRMVAAPLPSPSSLRGVNIEPGLIPTADELGLEADGMERIQQGGAAAAQRTLHSFLYTRGRHYHTSLSSPVTAFDACSRLSPHLAWGCLSIRQAVHALAARQAEVAKISAHSDSSDDRGWTAALSAFESRLYWRDHFIQKLEDAPRIEQQSFVTTYDGLRPSITTDWEARRRFIAWRDGKTGYPLVDACMRALKSTGYLNFRMRAMVVSFASHDLWLDWRETGYPLARWFTDMEPGIHWSQMQMQSGTSGNSTLRIYNPTIQANDHDPNGVFLRRWLPELRDVPLTYMHAPWHMPDSVQQAVGVCIGRDYPLPIVDHKQRWHEARNAISVIRQQPDTKLQVAQVLEKHGSRGQAIGTSDGWSNRKKAATRKVPAVSQPTLFPEAMLS